MSQELSHVISENKFHCQILTFKTFNLFFFFCILGQKVNSAEKYFKLNCPNVPKHLELIAHLCRLEILQ